MIITNILDDSCTIIHCGVQIYCHYFFQLESVDHRLNFINSAKDLVKLYGFDGLDLAWEFPETKPKKIRSGFSKI